MLRRLLIAANWKMNPIPSGALDADSPYRAQSNVDVVVFPTFLDLAPCVHARLLTGAQCGRAEKNGAFTGDVSIAMIKAIGCRYVLCGHSDRRLLHGETDAMIAAQAVAALEEGLHPIVCIGETAEEHEKEHTKKVLERQIKVLPLNSELTIAYEPVWAISGGDPSKPAASPDDAQEVHAFIRSLLPSDRRASTRILYGGSMKPENAEALLGKPDIDGGLVGGASNKPEAFQAIVAMAAAVKK
jgi:triosephosphate isomerase